MKLEDLNGNASIALEDASRTSLLGRSVEPETQGGLNTTVLGAGVYYVRVQAQQSGTVNYTFRYCTTFVDQNGVGEDLKPADNSPATGAPTISGIVKVGETLTANTSGISDSDGLTKPSFSYQWVTSDGISDTDIPNATAATYTLLPDNFGKDIRVRVTFTDEACNEESLTSAATTTVRYPGEALDWESQITPGQETHTVPLRSGYSSIGSLGGTLSPDSFEVDGTTYKVHHLVRARESLQLGMYRELPADFTLLVGDSVYRGSKSMVSPSSDGVGYWWASATPGWSGGEPVQVGLIIYAGVPLADRRMAPVTGYFQNFPSEHDGNEDFSFHIHFSEGVATTAEALRDHVLSVPGGTVSSVAAVGSEGRIWTVSVSPGSHDPVAVEIEPDVDCGLSAATCTGDGRRLFNHMELRVEPREKNPPTGSPTIIEGSVEAGQTLTADTSGIADADGLTGATFSYQWLSYDGTAYTDIQGATAPTYTLVPADEGKAFRVRVSFTDDAGNEQSLTSALARSERPYGLAASESDGAVALTWRLPAGWPDWSTFQILRNRPEIGETEPLAHVRYLQTAANTYTDTDVEPGVRYVYRVKGVDPFGYIGEASQPVEIRTGEPSSDETPPAPFNLRARANDDGSVTLSWDSPDDDSVTGYQVLRRTPGEAEYSMVGSTVDTGSTETTFTDDDLTQDVLHAYSVRATNTAGPSEWSNYDNATPHVVQGADGGPPTVYLTFDDGPHSLYTPQVLELLEQYGARATFFVTGYGAALHPDIIARMAAEGHGIGNHTWRHEWLILLTRDEFHSTVTRTQEQIGPHAAPCLRPPYGASNRATQEWMADLGLRMAMWNVDTKDYANPGVNRIVSVLSEEVSNGSVVLMHEHGGGGQTIEAVRIMLDRWARRGYQFKTVCEPPGVPVAPRNEPPEGVPTVSGPVQVGAVLTADTSGITDGDGLSGASFSHQWFADNSMLAGATGSSYLVAAEHEGQTIKVEASFADDAGNMQRLTSVPTAPVPEAERVYGSPQAPQDLSVRPTNSVGELLVNWSQPANHAGPEITGYRVEWKLSSGYWGRLSDVRGFRTAGTSHRITGLIPASHYVVRVRAVSQELEGAASEEVPAVPMGPLPLLAEFQDEPASHEGVGSRFSLRIAFSEAIADGFIELRDGALEVDGGIVLDASQANGRPDLWSLVFLPNGSGHVTVTLPATKDCSEWGAICTADGKKLANRLELTIPGAGNSNVQQAPPDNNPATGRPIIGGASEIGQTLTADTSRIADADGLTGATFSYQWLADDSDISGATGSGYTLLDGDEGETIKVRVSFTDDAGYAEVLTSPATAPVRPTGVLVWQSELTAGQKTDIFPVWSGYSSVGGFGGTLSSNAFVLDGRTYTVRFLMHSSESLWLGMLWELPMDFTLRVGDSAYVASESVYPSSASVGAYWWPLAVPDWSAAEPVQVSLAIHPGVPLGTRPRAPVTGQFRSYPSEHAGDEDLSFRVYFTEVVSTTADELRNHVLAVSGGAVSSVEAIDDEASIWAVTVTPESTGPVTVEIESGLDCQLANAVCTADGRRLFNRMELRVPGVATDVEGSTTQPGNNPAAGPPSIRGEARVGTTLRASLSALDDADGLSGATFSYQWLADDTDIQGATGLIYRPGTGDVGKIITVRVRFTDDAGYKEALTSAATEPVVTASSSRATGTPTISGTAQVGETLTANSVDTVGATGSSYTLVDVDEGKAIKVDVSFTDDAGNVETLTSAATAPIEPKPNSPAAGQPTITGAAAMQLFLQTTTPRRRHV